MNLNDLITTKTFSKSFKYSLILFKPSSFPKPVYSVTLESGLIIYRKGIRKNYYVIDKSIDGGLTWELDLVKLRKDEETIIIDIDDGVDGYRHLVRDGYYVIDHELTTTGFNGVENVDWENVYSLNNPLDVFEQVKYGLLYNWYAATNSRQIANVGWHLPTIQELITLSNYLGGNSVSGGKLKETGFDYWNSPNAGADNSTKFNLRGSGYREQSGTFTQLNQFTRLWSSSRDLGNPAKIAVAIGNYNNASLAVYDTIGYYMYEGNAIRLIKDSTTFTNGQRGIYTGNDGKTYRTICIGTQEWLADNLCETKYRSGDNILEITDNSTWFNCRNTNTAALCAYNNDWDNV